MTFLNSLLPSVCGEYCNHTPLNLFNSSQCQELATQAATGRNFTVLFKTATEKAVQVCLREDNYLAWLSLTQLSALKPVNEPYNPIIFYRNDIAPRLGEIIAFTKVAMEQPNYYLWGGTIGPNYDCSGLIQRAFAVSGIWLPRDSYQQEAFTKRIKKEELLAGDLIFFGQKQVNHVALYLGQGYYIHSSGKETGRNGIAIDPFSEQGDEISQRYYKNFWSCGRVMRSYSNSLTA
ncbi:MAG: C40 family peptidase [cyanobacterium endosymbiont of Rhopalodia musculus]|uniref:C40 family peptidase n=1 Tax=cyanobacterium endosymbiont of Epithemia clementina EcSB TaxID=3034674 RepID=UPI00247FCEA4|nr:C40 family peptidase [cyanobacterium endosymbiont of Epithemia clementina EcSB]WGT67679.1 C40 family peptidase [cyanobacterium endosymbiont of Epithemia clementina EcSB]